MRGPLIDQVVYDALFPNPKSTDPQNFQGLLQRHLVPEVRLETQAFYGHLASQEAKYPGLDYSYQPHRNRLSRFQWHRRLFRAFDNLGLTENEIAALTKWEGTRWAKERYEKEQGIVIRDTTMDSLPRWVEPHLRVPQTPQRANAQHADAVETAENEENEVEDEDEQDEDSDAEMQSVGIALNARLHAAVAQREAGNDSAVMDAEWEQWLKEVVEAGNLRIPTAESSLTSGSASTSITGTASSSNVPSIPSMTQLIERARGGQWSQIPEVLHGYIRQEIGQSDGMRSTTSRPWTLSSVSGPPAVSFRQRQQMALQAEYQEAWAELTAQGRITHGQGQSRSQQLSIFDQHLTFRRTAERQQQLTRELTTPAPSANDSLSSSLHRRPLSPPSSADSSRRASTPGSISRERPGYSGRSILPALPSPTSPLAYPTFGMTVPSTANRWMSPS